MIDQQEFDTQFDDLPFVLIPYIFKQLNLKDLINCRLVCKKFKYFCDECKIDELIINDNSRESWFYNNKPIDNSHAIRRDQLLSLDSIFYNLKKSLKYLHINQNNFIDTNDLQFVNSLNKLIHLDLKGVIHLDDHYCIKVPYLKILRLDSIRSENMILKVNAPRLIIMKCHQLKGIIILHPQSIEHLEIDEYCNSIEIMKNLKTLQCNKSLTLNKEIFTKFEYLNELICTQNIDEYNDEIRFEIMNEILNYLLKQKLILKRSIKIYFQGVHLIDRNKLSEYDLNDFKFQMINYNLLRNGITTVEQMNYNKLISMIDVIPGDLTVKFCNIRHISSGGRIIDKNRFIDFLSKLSHLNSICLVQSSLDQKFYEQLLNIGPLNSLAMCDDESLSIDFSFILKMKLLKSFKTNLEIANSFELALKAFSTLKHFINFQFRVGNEIIQCHKGMDNKFELSSHLQHLWQTTFRKESINYDELRTYFHRLKSSNSTDFVDNL